MAKKTFNYGKATPEERKKWITNDRSVAKPKRSFIDELEEHKSIGQSFDNGKWKPAHKGQTFIQALEAHKADSAGRFR